MSAPSSSALGGGPGPAWPPAAIGTEPAQWTSVGGTTGTTATQDYHAWNRPPVRTSPSGQPARTNNTPNTAALTWITHDSPLLRDKDEIEQKASSSGPTLPKIHVSGARVSLNHEEINDGYLVSTTRAFEGTIPDPDAAGILLSSAVFTRTELVDNPTTTGNAGDSYSVLQFTKGTQTSAALKALVVKTMGWNTPGVRDMNAAAHGLRDRPGTQLPALEPQRHDDPSGLGGQILAGTAYDGVATQIELASFQNTVDGLVPPTHCGRHARGTDLPCSRSHRILPMTNISR